MRASARSRSGVSRSQVASDRAARCSPSLLAIHRPLSEPGRDLQLTIYLGKPAFQQDRPWIQKIHDSDIDGWVSYQTEIRKNLMPLSDLANLGEFISSIAVLGSLGFLFFQMRQMTVQMRQSEMNQRSLINQNVMTRDHEINLMFAQLADVHSKAQMPGTELSLMEVMQLVLMLRAALGQMQDVHVQRQAGLIEQDTYDYIEAGVRSILAIPTYRAAWQWIRPAVSPKTVLLVEGFIATTPLANPQTAAKIPELLKSAVEKLGARDPGTAPQ